MSILSLNNLCNAILSMAATLRAQSKNIPSELKKDIESLFPLKFTPKQLMSAKNDMAKGVQCFEALTNSKFTFTFNPVLLMQLMSSPQFIEQEPALTATIISLSYLSWCVDHHSSESSEYMSLIIEILKLLANALKNDATFFIVSVSSIYHLVCDILSKKLDNYDFSAKVDIIDDILGSIPNLPDQFFEVVIKATTSLIEIYNNNNISAKVKSDSTSRFFNFLKKVMTNFTEKFPKKVINMLMPIICNLITALDQNTLDLILFISEKYGINAIPNFIPLITLQFVVKIEENKMLNSREESDFDYIELEQRSNIEFTNKIVINGKTDLDDTLDLKTSPVSFPEPIQLNKLTTPAINEIVAMIYLTFGKNIQLVKLIVSSLTNHFSDTGKLRNSYDAFVFSILLLNQLNTIEGFPLPIDIYTHKTIFDPCITVFTQGKNWSTVHSLRHAVIQILVHYEIEQLYKLIIRYSCCPLLFAELIYRLTGHLKNVRMSKSFVSTYYDILMETNIYYNSITNPSTTEIDAIKKARHSIFFLLEKLIRNQKCLTFLFNDENFLAAFTSLMFESTIRPLVINTFTKYAKKNSEEEDSIFKNKIIETFNSVYQCLDDPVYIKTCNEMLVALNNMINNNQPLLELFDIMIAPLCYGTLKLPSNPRSYPVLESTLLFLTLESSIHVLKSQEVSALETTITKVYKKQPPESCLLQLVQLTAGSNSAQIDVPFEIKQSKVLRITLLTFRNSPLLYKVLEYFENLCKFSEENTSLFHQNEIDKYLLHTISQYSEDENSDPKLIQKMLDLFKYIATYVSAVSVVQHFISLFCLTDGRFLPWFHQLKIDTFISLISQSNKHQIASVPFNQFSQFNIQCLKAEHIYDGFSFCCWVFANYSMPNYTLHLITFRDSKNQEIVVYLTWTSIIINVTNSGIIEFDYIVTTHEWSLITASFAYIPETEQLKISLYNNCAQIKEVSINSFKMEKGPVECKLGGTSEGSVNPNNPSVSSQFALYPILTNEQITGLFSIGCEKTDLKLRPMFAFIPYEPVDTIVIRNVVPNSNIISNTEITSFLPSSFSNTFCKRCGVDLILPLFAQWDILDKNKKEMEDLPQKSITIIKEALVKSIETQKFFNAAHGFEIISFLLHSVDQKHITFDLYISFYELFRVLTDNDLKVQLFISILTNSELWLRTTGLDHQKILDHTTKVLFPANPEISGSARQFKWVISLLYIYYYYTRDQPSIQYARPNKIDVKICRKYLVSLALFISTQKLINSDLYYLVCVCTNCRDPRLQYDYLFILNCLIEKGRILPLVHAKDTFKFLKVIQFLANSINKDVSMLAMKTLASFYQARFFPNDSVDAQFDIIHHHMSAALISINNFDWILECVNGKIPELFSIISWMSFNLGESAINKMYKRLKPNFQFTISASWCVWPVITMFKFSEEIAQNIAAFIIRCSFAKFEQIYGLVEIVGRAIGVDTEVMKAMILEEFHKALLGLSSFNESMLRQYFKCTRHFLFYRTEDKRNRSLIKLFDQSPFKFDPNDDVSVPLQTFEEKIVQNRNKPLLNSDGTERYSPIFAQKAVLILQPRSTENSSKSNPSQKAFLSTQSNLFKMKKTDASENVRKISQDKISSSSKLLANDTLTIYREIQIRNVKFHFGIRESDDQKWIDETFALNFVKMYEISPLKEYETTIIMICTILLLYNSNLAYSILTKLKVNLVDPDLLNALSFFDKIAIMLKKERLLVHSEQEVLFQSNEFLNNFMSQEDENLCEKSRQLISQIKEYEDKNSISSYAIYKLVTTDISSIARNTISDFKDNISQEKTTSNKYWQQLWHCISIERAPWHKSLPQIMLQQTHYRRELTMCWSCFPPKLKQNYKFDDHVEASFIRDTGSKNTGKSKAEQYREQLQSMYELGAPPSIFEINEDAMKQKESSNISSSKKIIELPCEVIKVGKIYDNARFLLMKNCIVLTISDKKSTVISIKKVTSVFPRTRFHHLTAIEIFTNEGLSYFINFPNFSLSQVLRSFKSLNVQPQDFKQSFSQSKLMERWLKHEISNFQYLMYLNIYSGRTINDISQYPVYPWVLKDYTSDELDLTNPAVFRDLSKPVGALDEKRLNEIKEKVSQLENAGMDPYFYSSTYSCPLSVCLYLVRLEPYTTLHIDIQGGCFDVPARLFSTISDTFRLVNTTHNDFREIIPEFYSMPEFLTNSDRFDLGVTEGRKIDDVVLPPWSNSSPIEFIYLHRKALESDYVTAHLNDWIDLIWGDKQRGEKAKAAQNVYMREMYPDIWDETPLDDLNARANVEAMLCHIGQIPQQLFDKPHPQCEPTPQKEFKFQKREIKLDMKESKIKMIAISPSDKGEVAVYIVDENYSPNFFFYDPSSVFRPIPSQEGAHPLLQPNALKRLISARPSPTTPEANSFYARVPSSGSLSNMSTIIAQKESNKIIVSFNHAKAFDFVCENLHELFRISPSSEMSLRIKHRSEITAISSDQDWTAVADRDSVVALYHKDTLMYSIPLFSSSVKCMALSTTFHLAVCGTRDGFLLFCSLNTGFITKTVNLNGMRPTSVLITPSWGFVAVYFTELYQGELNHYVKLFSVNGDFIRSRKLNHSVAIWDSFSTYSGFDYIIMSTSGNSIFMFEAFYLDFGPELYKSSCSIDALTYLPNEQCVVAASSTGKITFFTAKLNQP